jgi:superfamily II DNA/RNA helicase
VYKNSRLDLSSRVRRGNINAVLINDNIPQKDRLLRLNKIAIQQMTILVGIEGRKLLK